MGTLLIELIKDLELIPFLSFAPQHATVHNAVTEALKKGFEKNWYILGADLQKFEAEYASYNNVRYCFGVGNGYDALAISLRALNIGRGDEVIVPSHTYVATWLAISNCGARVIPVEPDPLTLQIDVHRIEEEITPKTKVILPVHLYGYPNDMSSIMTIARRHSLAVIEDNAQAHGAKWNGKFTGSFGDINATSFYPTKNLGALGDGGAITTDQESLAEFVMQYRNYGFSRKNYLEVAGINSRLDELQASVLAIKLKYLDQWNEQRRTIANQYIKRLQGIGDIQLPQLQQSALPVFHLFVVRTARREKLQEFLASSQIETMVHYPLPPHLQKPYSTLDLKRKDLSLTEKIADTCLSLPLWPGMTENQVDYVCDRIVAYFLQ